MIHPDPAMRRQKLIINADDFGLCDSVDAGIIECLLDGKLTDLSFLVNFEAFNASVDLLKSIGKIRVGIHINLTAGRSILGPLVSRLTDANGFYFDLKSLAWKISINQIDSAAIYREIKAQFELLLDSGLGISHIDSHRNIHLLPGIMRPLLKVVADLGIEATIRMPAEALGSVLRAQGHNVARLLILKLLTLNCSLRTGYHSTVTSIGGNFFNNPSPEIAFCSALQALQKSLAETFEFAVHPGYFSNKLTQYDTYGQQRERELKFLKSNNDFDFNAAGIDLVSFDDILANETPANYPHFGNEDGGFMLNGEPQQHAK
jgi:predicted glycoside hydrolase/deacetylase ChbG (UPF0249 family)